MLIQSCFRQQVQRKLREKTGLSSNRNNLKGRKPTLLLTCLICIKGGKDTLSLYSKTAICQQIGFNNWNKIYRLVYSALNMVIVNIKVCVRLSNNSPVIKFTSSLLSS